MFAYLTLPGVMAAIFFGVIVGMFFGVYVAIGERLNEGYRDMFNDEEQEDDWEGDDDLEQ